MTKTKKIEVLIILSILVGMVFLTLSPVLAADENLSDSGYPKYQADNQNTGQSQYTGPQNNSTKWNYTIGDTNDQLTQTPSIGPDGTIYLPVHNITNYRGNLFALNSDGTLKWNYTINYGTHSEIVGSPAICEDGTIYILGQFSNNQRNFGTLLALNPDGTLKWNYTINDGTSVFMYGSPAIGADGTIYFSDTFTQGSAWYVNYYALNPNGTLKWNYTDTNVVSGAYSTSSPAIGPDGTIYFRVEFMNQGLGNAQHKLVAMNPNGTVKWDKFIPFGTILYKAPSVATDGTIYIAGWFNFANPTPELFAYNPDGTLKWTYIANEITDGWFETTPAIANDGTIYVGGYGTTGGILYAINSNGTKKWSNQTSYGLRYDPVIGADGTIYFGDNTLHALNPNNTQKWTLNIISFTAPVIGPDGTLYVGMASYIDGSNYPAGYSLLAINTPNSNNDPTNNTNNTQSTSNVQAATTTTVSGNTVGMQTTGAPIMPLALAVLGILGGLAATRKKH